MGNQDTTLVSKTYAVYEACDRVGISFNAYNVDNSSVRR